MKYTCPKTPSMFRKCDNIFLLCNVTHLRLGLGKLFMLGIHETWTFFPPNQKELKTKIEPAFSLILYLCSFLFMIQYDGRKMDRHFEKKLIWELLGKFDQKYPQKLRMSGPENHSGPSRTIQISMPGVFPTKMLLIKL